MTNLSKFAALTLAALMAGTTLAVAGPFDLPNIVIDKGTVKTPNPPHPTGPKPPHPTGPKPPHPTTISDLDDPLEGYGPAKKLGPDAPGGGSNGGAANNGASMEAQVDCAVPGDAYTTTNDLLIANIGNVDLEAGLKLKFHVRTSGDRGAFILLRSIGPGKQLRIPDMLHGAVAGAPCDAQIL